MSAPPLGYGDLFTWQYPDLLGAIAGRHEPAPDGPTFEDGYRAAEVCNAVLAPAASGARVEVSYR